VQNPKKGRINMLGLLKKFIQRLAITMFSILEVTGMPKVPEKTAGKKEDPV